MTKNDIDTRIERLLKSQQELKEAQKTTDDRKFYNFFEEYRDLEPIGGIAKNVNIAEKFYFYGKI